MACLVLGKAYEAERVDTSGEDRTGFTYNSNRAYSLSQQRARLPVFEVCPSLLLYPCSCCATVAAGTINDVYIL
jgi:hypothetical protein